MNYCVKRNCIYVQKTDFNIEHILECGQIFSYQKTQEGYVVFSADKKAEVIEENEQYIIKTQKTAYFEEFFDLRTDYSQIKKSLSKHEILKKPIEFGSGIRILKQDLFETLISFIVSANNNIKRIKQILFRMREQFGKKMGDFFAFPTREQLLGASVDDFAKMGAGYRAKYLFEVVRQIDEQKLQKMRDFDTQTLRKELIKLSGVGPKVADCVLLFGFGRKDVFPVDTWIAQMYNKYYQKLENREKIRENLTNEFQELSGYAQQYLFFFMRSEKV